MKNISIKTKLIILNIAVLLILLLFFLFNVNFNMLKNYKRVGKDFNLSTEHLFNIVLKDHMLNPINKNPNDLLKIVSDNRKLEKARIIDENGIIKYSLDSTEVDAVLLNFYSDFIKFRIDTVSSRLRWEIDENRRAYLTPIFNKKDCRNCHGQKPVIAYLNTQMNYQENLDEIRSTFNNILLTSVVVFIIIFVSISLTLNQLIFKRILSFGKAFNEIKNKNLSFRFKNLKNDEIGLMEKNFNDMIEELQNSKLVNEELYLEKLKNIDKLINIGSLTAELAHEINNYSAILKSRLDYFENEFENKPDLQEYYNDVKTMIHQVENMSITTKNILKHSKNRKHENCETSIKEIIEEIQLLFHNNLKKKKISLEIKKIPNIKINANSAQIEQVFINLLTNSIDAIEYNGKIIIEGKHIENRLEILVKDSGPGIDENSVENIFMPFYSTKGENHGSGLGLYIVKNILDKHNAQIDYINSETGAIFKITFRVNNEEN